MKIVCLDAKDVKKVSFLFDAYRQFYGRKSNLEFAQQFLLQRLTNNESVIFAAGKDEKEFAGFVQLYPVFSSLSMSRVWVLNDLYVKEAYRRQGIAEQLMAKVHQFGTTSGAGSIVLETAPDNTKAQELYKKLGYQRDTMLHLFFDLDK